MTKEHIDNFVCTCPECWENGWHGKTERLMTDREREERMTEINKAVKTNA